MTTPTITPARQAALDLIRAMLARDGAAVASVFRSVDDVGRLAYDVAVFSVALWEQSGDPADALAEFNENFPVAA